MIKSLNKEMNVTELDQMMVELESKIELGCSGAACGGDAGNTCGAHACGGYVGLCGAVACFPFI